MFYIRCAISFLCFYFVNFIFTLIAGWFEIKFNPMDMMTIVSITVGVGLAQTLLAEFTDEQEPKTKKGK